MMPAATISFKLTDPIFNVCRTTWERQEFLAEMHDIEKKMYTDENVDLNVLIKNACRDSTYEIINLIVGNEPDKAISRIQAMSRAIKTIPETEVSLAVEPKVAMIDRIWKKVTSGLGKPVILNLKYDPMLIGGATITYGGKYGDYSLKRKIDTYLTKEVNT